MQLQKKVQREVKNCASALQKGTPEACAVHLSTLLEAEEERLISRR
jgi:hypothetical protein